MRKWSEDFITSIPEIDEQHKRLFEIINLFSIKESMYQPGAFRVAGMQDMRCHVDALEFLDELEEYAALHFAEEEKWMREKKYPLLGCHILSHKAVVLQLRQVRQQLLEHNLEEPLQTVLEFAYDWLNDHIAKEDLAFFDFCNNKYYAIDHEYESTRCEITSMRNKLLCLGHIKRVENSQILIDCDNEVPVMPSDIVKVTIASAKLGMRVLIARVVGYHGGVLRLFNARLVTPLNKRQYIRVPTGIKTNITADECEHAASIQDISVGGMLVSADEELRVNDTVKLEFELLNHDLALECKIVRITKGAGAAYSYGCKFLGISGAQSDIIAEFVFHAQRQQRIQVKKRSAPTGRSKRVG